MSRLRKSYTFLRWMLKAPRHVGMTLRRLVRSSRMTAQSAQPLPGNALYEEFQRTGYGTLRAGSSFRLPDVDMQSMAGRARSIVFHNALPEHWETLKPLITEVLADARFADCLLRYFDGQPWLWNVALNYSEAGDGVRDSQLWHFDYGDVKQLHALLYFSEVDGDCGPFTFFPAGPSARVPRSKWVIERLDDEQLRARAGIAAADAVRLTGGRGDFFIVDPGRVLHQGARCVKPRLVMFLTFTTPTPMSLGGSATLQKPLRLDLSEHYRRTLGPRAVFRHEFFI